MRKRSKLFVLGLMAIVIMSMCVFAAFADTTTPADDTAKDTEVVSQSEEPVTTIGATEEAAEEEADEEEAADLTDSEAAQEYLDNYADNVEAEDFEANVETALGTVRKDIPFYATPWALLPPLIAIVLALITKEVYSSLFVGILAGGLLYANFNPETTMTHVFSDGFIANVADSYNIGIIIFLVVLGALVAMMNKTGGSAAFGRWTSKHIKTRLGAQLATIALGVLIFVDDYFNCLTVGSVMRPVTDRNKISRSKLAYLIDATAAPVCIIAPISSWAAAVSGFAKGAGAENGMSLFIRAIPYNFYALLTIAMMIFLAVSNFDYGPMKKHENNAAKGDLFTTGDKYAEEKEAEVGTKGKVIDLVIPVVFLIIACIFGLIYSGGFFNAGDSDNYMNFISAFSSSDASVGLVYGSFITLIFAVIYFMCRRVISFKGCMEAIPEGFKAMVPAIMILVCAWTLKGMTDSLGAKICISQFVEGSIGSLQKFLPGIIFLIAVGLSFATGTSWGTFGILIPIVLTVFNGQSGNITIIAVSACMAGAVCGDHCSPISDTTIMASAGAQCNHINHVSTQLPYALTVAGVSFVSYLIAGILTEWYISLPIAIALMLATLFVIKAISSKAAK